MTEASDNNAAASESLVHANVAASSPNFPENLIAPYEQYLDAVSETRPKTGNSINTQQIELESKTSP